MALWLVLWVIFIAGGVGGAVNAMLTGSRLNKPAAERVQGVRLMRPSFVENVFIGGIAALVSQGLYGPFASTNLLEPQALSLTPSTVAGAILVGTSGAKWLTSELDKRLLRVVASEAARAPASHEAAEQILTASPVEALKITKSL